MCALHTKAWNHFGCLQNGVQCKHRTYSVQHKNNYRSGYKTQWVCNVKNVHVLHVQCVVPIYKTRFTHGQWGCTSDGYFNTRLHLVIYLFGIVFHKVGWVILHSLGHSLSLFWFITNHRIPPEFQQFFLITHQVCLTIIKKATGGRGFKNTNCLDRWFYKILFYMEWLVDQTVIAKFQDLRGSFDVKT